MLWKGKVTRGKKLNIHSTLSTSYTIYKQKTIWQIQRLIKKKNQWTIMSVRFNTQKQESWDTKIQSQNTLVCKHKWRCCSWGSSNVLIGKEILQHQVKIVCLHMVFVTILSNFSWIRNFRFVSYSIFSEKYQIWIRSICSSLINVSPYCHFCFFLFILNRSPQAIYLNTHFYHKIYVTSSIYVSF